MNLFTLAQAAQWVAGSRIHGDASQAFERVSTDSRTVGPGDLFIALKGEHFDAHDFLPEVATRGAAAVLVKRLPSAYGLPALQVDDTLQALGALARGWRRGFSGPLVAVTGSNGKTTVKEMIAAIFAAAVGEKHRLATRGNLNNEIGVPLTLFRLMPAHALAVVELGMNHPGETAVLAALAEPTIALVNNAQREHQEFMATVEAVALEHADVIHALPGDGIAVYPADDAYSGIWRAAATGHRTLEFALGKPEQSLDEIQGDVRGQLLPRQCLRIATPQGRLDITLRVLGEHNARNALAAIAAGLAAGVGLPAIGEGLERFEPFQRRSQVKTVVRTECAGATVIDDSYNANPDSMRAAITLLAQQSGMRILAIGDMGEVGDQGPAFHREVGSYARESGIDAIYALGEASRAACQMFGTNAHHFNSMEALLEALFAAGLDHRATLLVKGSRFMRMWRVVDALTVLSTSATPDDTSDVH
jgi:UDP-N-acetylmuramoyl-tripeptide--D-alanyl-D-alanine ligase